jgi:hypothetical protein
MRLKVIGIDIVIAAPFAVGETGKLYRREHISA